MVVFQIIGINKGQTKVHPQKAGGFLSTIILAFHYFFYYLSNV